MESGEGEPKPQQRILVVDDEREWGDRIGEIFERQGAEVTVVETAEEAQSALVEGEFNQVFTDSLGDGWKQVAENASGIEERPEVTVISNDSGLRLEVEKQGLHFEDKLEYVMSNRDK